MKGNIGQRQCKRFGEERLRHALMAVCELCTELTHAHGAQPRQ